MLRAFSRRKPLTSVEPPEAARVLETTRIFEELPREGRREALERLTNTAAFFFEHPDLDPDGDLARFAVI